MGLDWVVAGGQRGGFERADDRGADGDDAATLRYGAVDCVGSFGRNGITLAVQAHLVDALDTKRRECAEADVEGDVGYFDAFADESVEDLRREVQSGCGRGDGTALIGKDGLIALAIGIGVVAMDVGRQRDVADLVEHGEEVICRVREWRELEKTLAELAALDDFGFERNCAVWRREDQALADGDFAAGANESAPAILRRRVQSA